MSSRPPLPAGPYLVVGLARSGAAAARLLRGHAAVIACDAGAPVEAAGLKGVEVHLRSDGVDLLERVRTVVKSPGVPQSAAVIEAARDRGMEVIGELELAWRLLPNEFVAVTGTNGKTTTVELLGAILRAAGRPVAIAGNVGTALSSLVGQVDRGVLIVAECSSFQLEDALCFAPECAVLLNITEDHLDRHGTLEAYSGAKLRIFERQRADCAAVCALGFAQPRGQGEPQLPGEAQTVFFGGPGADLERRAEALRWRGEPLVGVDEIRLRGEHNRQNAMAAAAAALTRGIEPAAVRAALTTFGGVPHRLEDLGERDGVIYVNDSKATNVASTRMALAAFDGGVQLILGGREKGGGFGSLRELVGERCRACYLIGEAAARLERDLAGSAPLTQAGTLERAVRAARQAAHPGDVVLLSPACASYDQYESFEQRGAHFRALFEE